jgi:hypothetical protein
VTNTKPKLDSQFKRLHTFLIAAQAVQGGSNRVALGKLLSVDPGNTIAIYDGLVRMSHVLDEIPDLLKSKGHDETAEYAVEHLNGVRRFLSVENFDMPWDGYKQQRLRAEDLSAIKMCASIISGSAPEIIGADLEDIRLQTEALYEQIKVAEIDNDLKTVLLASLDQMKNAIRGYSLWGTEGLQESLSQLVGVLVLYAPKIHDETVKRGTEGTDTKAPWWDALTDLVIKIGGLTAGAESVFKLSQWVEHGVRLLLPK